MASVIQKWPEGHQLEMPGEACCNIGRAEAEMRERRPEAKRSSREDTQGQGERPGRSQQGSGADTSELLLKDWDK